MAAATMPQRLLVLLYHTLVVSCISYGLGILTLSKTQLQRLERIQNEAMRTILGCTRDTSVEAMRFVLNFPAMEKRHKFAQVDAYLRVASDRDNPLHDKIGTTTTSRLKRGTSWLAQAAKTIGECCAIEDIRKGPAWIPIQDDNLTEVIAVFGR